MAPPAANSATTLATIFGHARVVGDLRRAVASGRVHHAYLFEGPPGVGKATVARALAATLNCERRADGATSGCGACDACHKIEAGTHPDFLVVDMTAKGLTERMRTLQGELGFAPHEGRARFILVDPADALAGAQGRAEPANVLLKTLEEPPAATHFVLITSEARRLPVTVLSRCQRLRFGGFAEAELAQFAVERRGAEPAQARRAAQIALLSGGGIGATIAALDEEAESSRITEQVEALLAPCDPGPERFERAATLGGDRDEIDRVLALAETTLAAQLRARVVDDGAPAAGQRTVSEILSALEALGEARESTTGNVAPALVLEHVLARLARHRTSASPSGRAPSSSSNNPRKSP